MDHVTTVASPPTLLKAPGLEVHEVPVWHDNYAWLLVDRTRGKAVVVDGPQAEEVQERCATLGVTLEAIWNTHTHPDHIGINRALGTQVETVVASKTAKREVPFATMRVGENDTFTWGAHQVRVWLTEGHEDGHITFLISNGAFTGDTLFAGGCGYLFDGPPKKMLSSLRRLATLPDDTWVFCAHEYTEDNLRFATTVDGASDALVARYTSVQNLRAQGKSTLPTQIGTERATNPFLRCQTAQIAKSVSPDDDAELAVFTKLRALKDLKKY